MRSEPCSSNFRNASSAACCRTGTTSSPSATPLAHAARTSISMAHGSGKRPRSSGGRTPRSRRASIRRTFLSTRVSAQSRAPRSPAIRTSSPRRAFGSIAMAVGSSRCCPLPSPRRSASSETSAAWRRTATVRSRSPRRSRRCWACALRRTPPPQTNHFHVYLDGDAGDLQRRADAYARETGTFVFARLAPTTLPDKQRWEFVALDATLALDLDEIVRAARAVVGSQPISG